MIGILRAKQIVVYLFFLWGHKAFYAFKVHKVQL
jgi:hypothetical protein